MCVYVVVVVKNLQSNGNRERQSQKYYHYITTTPGNARPMCTDTRNCEHMDQEMFQSQIFACFIIKLRRTFSAMKVAY